MPVTSQLMNIVVYSSGVPSLTGGFDFEGVSSIRKKLHTVWGNISRHRDPVCRVLSRWCYHSLARVGSRAREFNYNGISTSAIRKRRALC